MYFNLAKTGYHLLNYKLKTPNYKLAFRSPFRGGGAIVKILLTTTYNLFRTLIVISLVYESGYTK